MQLASAVQGPVLWLTSLVSAAQKETWMAAVYVEVMACTMTLWVYAARCVSANVCAQILLTVHCCTTGMSES